MVTSAGGLPVVRVGGTRIHAITERQCVDHILEQLDAKCGGWVVTVNLDHLRLFSRDAVYAALCAQASLAVADGMPLVWASRLQGTPVPERVAGVALLESLSAAAARRERTVFLLGGSPGAAQATAAVLQGRHPGLRVAGTLCPTLDLEEDPQAMSRVTELVSAAGPDVVYVGLGKPKQDRVIAILRDKLPHAWFVGVGITFSFISGAVPRAPAAMQRLGLEWLHRLAQEPQRLAARYLVHGLPAAGLLLGGALLGRWLPRR